MQTPRFDARSAQHLKKPRVLSGPAWVTDGDTITINKTQIRLFGIDAPELNHPYGVRAKRALMRFCKGQTIRAEVTDEDHHGRTVARCFLPDGRDLSAEMVKLGLALDWPKFSGGKYRGLEVPEARRKLFLADARQKGRMHVWEQFEARQRKS
ncbi:MAG: thermonuclease family protein [Paracoccaceae bacterium]